MRRCQRQLDSMILKLPVSTFLGINDFLACAFLLLFFLLIR
jgi:hypothetical protein